MSYIASDMRLVLDTSVMVAGLRSPTGASAELLRRVLRRKVIMVASVPLFVEYEAVLLREEHLAAASAAASDVLNLLDVLAGMIEEVELRFLWRPQLPDPDDDMVLEAAVNGRADAVVTFNERHFRQPAARFGIAVLIPSGALRSVER